MRNGKYLGYFAIMLAASIFCGGCAGTLRVTSDPAGATVYRSSGAGPYKEAWSIGELTNRGGWPTYAFGIGEMGPTPVEFKRVWQVEAVKVRWPDGVESQPQYSPESSSGSSDWLFHFERKDVPSKALDGVSYKMPFSPKPELSHEPGCERIVGDRWAFIVGLSNYRDSRIPAIRYAASDALSFYEWLVSPEGGRYAPSRVKLLLDADATNVAIKEALFSWLAQALEEDVVTIYFAGHGSPQSPDKAENLFLLTFDARYDNLPSTAFPMWDIETALKRYIKAKKVVVIADACHSGGVGQSFDIARRSSRGLKVNPISTSIENLSKLGDGVCVISASDEKQYSQESKDWGGGHGVFTYFLLKGLKGNADYNKDASVTLGELTSYLSQEVRRATKNAQSPTVAGRYDPALTIGK